MLGLLAPLPHFYSTRLSNLGRFLIFSQPKTDHSEKLSNPRVSRKIQPCTIPSNRCRGADMARPSKLTEKQWAQIKDRLLKGDAIGAVAKDFKIGRTTITDRFPGGLKSLKELANQIVSVDSVFAALPVSDRVSVTSLVEELKAISGHLASAARFGSATAHRLAGIAHNQVQLLDDAEPLGEESMDALKGIAVLTRMSNDASVIGINLLNANKESVKIINNAPQTMARTIDPSKLSDATIKELLASRETQ